MLKHVQKVHHKRIERIRIYLELNGIQLARVYFTVDLGKWFLSPVKMSQYKV